jgi:hypothetical protein
MLQSVLPLVYIPLLAVPAAGRRRAEHLMSGGPSTALAGGNKLNAYSAGTCGRCTHDSPGQAKMLRSNSLVAGVVCLEQVFQCTDEGVCQVPASMQGRKGRQGGRQGSGRHTNVCTARRM